MYHDHNHDLLWSVNLNCLDATVRLCCFQSVVFCLIVWVIRLDCFNAFHNCEDHSLLDWIALSVNFLAADSVSRTSSLYLSSRLTIVWESFEWLSTSFQGSFTSASERKQGKKDPGAGCLCVSQKVGGDEKSIGGGCNQGAILSFLNPLWRGYIRLKI